MLKFISIWSDFQPPRFNFKTSYVEVYPTGGKKIDFLIVFQNILCWSLSSRQWNSAVQALISKHLMLKFILYCHVILWTGRGISKHLMLKFIAFRINSAADSYTFQNILCWSLSRLSLYIISIFAISKHLMLKFIGYIWFWKRNCSNISKHLMLKFIQFSRVPKTLK